MEFIKYLFSKAKILWTLGMSGILGFYLYCAIFKMETFYVETTEVWIIAALLTGIVASYFSGAYNEWKAINGK